MPTLTPPSHFGALHLDQAGRLAVFELASILGGPPRHRDAWHFEATRDWDDFPAALATCPFVHLRPFCRRVFAFRPKNWVFQRNHSRPEDGRHWGAALMGYMTILPITTLPIPTRLFPWEAQDSADPESIAEPLPEDAWLAWLVKRGRELLGVQP